MARKHIPVTIVRPGVEEMVGYSFETVDQTDLASFIPFRYPFADISNYAALKTAGFFRHGLQQPSGGSASAAVSSELGGSETADASTTLGYHLPRSEKLVLLVQVAEALTTGTDKVSVTISGSSKYLQDAIVFESPAGPAAGSIFEIPLFNFGLYIGDEGEIKVSQGAFTTADDKAHIKYALVSREG
jgi:hypothetical protein